MIFAWWNAPSSGATCVRGAHAIAYTTTCATTSRMRQVRNPSEDGGGRNCGLESCPELLTSPHSVYHPPGNGLHNFNEGSQSAWEREVPIASRTATSVRAYQVGREDPTPAAVLREGAQHLGHHAVFDLGPETQRFSPVVEVEVEVHVIKTRLPCTYCDGRLT